VSDIAVKDIWLWLAKKRKFNDYARSLFSACLHRSLPALFDGTGFVALIASKTP